MKDRIVEALVIMLIVCLLWSAIIVCACHSVGATKSAGPAEPAESAEPVEPVARPAGPAEPAAGPAWQVVTMKVTAYCPCSSCCGNCSPGITASGHEISKGDKFVAADGRYSFGLEIIVPGYTDNDAPVKVLDRGGAIKNNRVDVFFDTHQAALEWGVKILEVRIQIEE